MTSSKIFSWLLIAYQASLQHWWQIGMLGRMATTGILLLTLVPHFRIQLNKTVHAGLLVAFALAFGLEGLNQLPTQGIYGLFKLLSEYLLIVQAFELIRGPRPTTANYLPGLSILTFAMLLMSVEDAIATRELNYLSIAFVLLLTLAMRPDLISLLMDGRREGHRGQLLVMILGTAIASGWLFQTELNRNLPQLRQLFSGLNLGSDDLTNAAFELRKAPLVDQAGLGSLNQRQLEQSEDLAFFVHAKNAPGYMRTVAFAGFDGTEWKNPWAEGRVARSIGFRRISATSKQILDSLNSSGRFAAGMSLFELNRTAGNSEPQAFTVEIPRGRGKSLPIPFDATHVLGKPIARVSEILVDPHGSIFRGTLENQSFTYLRGDEITDQPDAAYLQSLLTVPTEESDFLREFSSKICNKSSTSDQKMLAIQEFFQANFTYSVTAQPNKNLGGRSPLRAFLSDRREAHCEFFATATALLLRSQGIPCRLAIGYLVYEQSDETGDYVALNRNAHAWVEAYNPESQAWTIVESTPTIPDYIRSRSTEGSDIEAVQAGETAALLDKRLSLYDMIDALRMNVYSLWYAIIGNRFAWLLPGILAACYIAYRYGLFGWHRRKQHFYTTALVRKADRLALKLGLERSASETCLRFADRMLKQKPDLIALARWYQQYSETRYRADSKVPPKLPTIRLRTLNK